MQHGSVLRNGLVEPGHCSSSVGQINASQTPDSLPVTRLLKQVKSIAQTGTCTEISKCIHSSSIAILSSAELQTLQTTKKLQSREKACFVPQSHMHSISPGNPTLFPQLPPYLGSSPSPQTRGLLGTIPCPSSAVGSFQNKLIALFPSLCLSCCFC